MTIKELRKLIYEDVEKAVRKVVRTEIRDILLEVTEKQSVPNLTQEEGGRPKMSISDVLQETEQAMDRKDYRNFLGDSTDTFKTAPILEEKKQILPGMPDFIATAALKAKSILDTSNQKDKERHGI